jgi:hypothetical protein
MILSFAQFVRSRSHLRLVVIVVVQLFVAQGKIKEAKDTLNQWSVRRLQ